MADRLTPAQRSALMSRIRGKGTSPERAVFAALRKAGLKFRRHDSSLPGSPDAVFWRERVAVFIEGDFWHGWHLPRWRDKLPEYWRVKIERNRRRDRNNARKLRRAGWKVVRIWEHSVKSDLDACIRRLSIVLSCEASVGNGATGWRIGKRR